MNKVISIKPQHEVILGFLFPDHTLNSPVLQSNAIVKQDIKSAHQRQLLDTNYDNLVVISSQIFDEVWSEEKIKEECILFSRKTFKNKKRSFTTTEETFVDDCVNFIFGIPSLSESVEINELFSSYGSTSFVTQYFKISNSIPYQQLFAAMVTFIAKIRKDSSSVFYKKKAYNLEDKINNNLIKSMELYNDSIKGDGVAECFFLLNLLK